MGQVESKDNISAEQLNQLRSALAKHGLELMDDKKVILIEKNKRL
jgi:hypothetical protein